MLHRMLPAALALPPEIARRFHRRAVLLDAPVNGIGAALDHHGFVQIDPINVCGRMQDHILRHRVAGYREGDLMRHVHGAETSQPALERVAFEHHLPDSHVLVAFPLDAWPHLLAAMHRRTRHSGAWSGKLTARERELAARILEEIATRGPLEPSHIDDDRRSRQSLWGSFSLAKSTLQKLFFHGRVLIAGRDHNRRLYDLPERVLPPAVLARREPGPEETARWIVHLKLRQRRLVTLKRNELPLVEDLVQPIAVPDCPPLFCLRSDLGLLDDVTRETCPPASDRARLIAPLDPLIYDRRVTAALWKFDYTWEVYTPPHKRVRGYYALPVMQGDRLLGHVDPKADRTLRRLVVVSRRVEGRSPTAPAVRELATFLGLRAR
ncbi:DNA glycosylase AlkZ-like family protein [Horticoccus sp. 23ND18S-11]|uniref:DNA glycosylase AlkZ-like family protein n=1 Tax=Horticoccus sp. 23ND18S-11 TaxID=3391832 RepID=UPI0039C9DA57